MPTGRRTPRGGALPTGRLQLDTPDLDRIHPGRFKVVYDLLGFQSRDHGERGIARLVLQLALALERNRPGLVTDYLIHPDLPFPAGAEQLIATGRIRSRDSHSTGRCAANGGVLIAGSPFETFNHSSELVLPRFARTNRWRNLVVLHDLVPAHFPDIYLQGPESRKWYAARRASLALFDHFLANSQATADDALDMLDLDETQVTVIGAGADRRFRPPREGSRAAARSLANSGLVEGLRPGYILFPTGIDPRKNVERTIEAYGRLPRSLRSAHQLVLSCRLSDPDRETVMALAAKAGVADDLLVTGYVSDVTLCRLYQGAHLVVFPSYYEGFGLPALEAMHCGAPVICADATSLVEVQPIAEARFDPWSVRNITAAMTRALTDDGLRHRLRTQEPPPFTWDRAGQRAGEVIKTELLDLDRRDQALAPTVGTVGPSGSVDTTTRSHQAPPRLAVFAPLPPQQTGAAVFAGRLIDELRHHCQVTVFVDCEAADANLAPTDLQAPDGVTVQRVSSFDAVAAGGAAFDQVLYLVGDDPHHLAAFNHSERHPGHLLFRGARLTEIYRAIHQHRRDRLVDGSVGRTLAALYPARYRAEVEDMDVIDPATAHRFGVLMARGLGRSGREVIVDSTYAQTLLRLDGAGDAEVLFTQLCPTVDRLWSAPNTAPVITAFGSLDLQRCPGRLMRAMPTILATHPDCELHFVGRLDPDRRSALTELATQLGIDGAVHFTSDLDDEQIAARQRETTLAVQLSDWTDGATSETVGELLATGTPLVITDLGSASELPEDAVVKVESAIEPPELARALIALLDDPERQVALSMGARRYAGGNTFGAAASKLANFLFTTPSDRRASLPAQLVEPQINLDLIERATSVYLGDHVVLTRLFNGQQLYVDGRDTSVAPALLLDGHWEPENTALFMMLLQPSSCVIDIGANFGYFGILAGSVVDRRAGGSIHMIEANPHLSAMVQRSVAVNGLHQVATISSFAISDGPGKLQLEVPRHLWGSSSLDGLDVEFESAIGRSLGTTSDPQAANRNAGLGVETILPVEAIDLDRFTAERGIDRVDVIKIDIEGHEERAYRGMTEVIARNRAHLQILIEFSSARYRDPVGFFEQLLDDLSVVSIIDPGTGHLIPITDHDELLEVAGPDFAMLLAGPAGPGPELEANVGSANQSLAPGATTHPNAPTYGVQPA